MRVAIIDYGSGNLRSAAKAFERASLNAGLQTKVIVTGQASDLHKASHIVLPGVGAFVDCKKGLESLDGMLEALECAVIKEAKPFLGICVGMQLMATTGYEHGKSEGLGWIKGEVVPLQCSDQTLKIPHMGWNELIFSNNHSFLDGVALGAHVYFVHSYGVVAAEEMNVLAQVDYGGAINAIIGRDNMIGVQFHPEKSQSVGLHLISNFLKWRP